MKYSKIIVALVIVLNSAFAAAVLVVFAMTGVEPVVLIGAWFSFTIGELWLLAGIKKVDAKAKTDIDKIKARKEDKNGLDC